ncbi:MAG: hypothetical protein ACXAAI_05150 [Promethearchaeota archaeon]
MKVKENTNISNRVCPTESMNSSISSFQSNGLPVSSLKLPMLIIIKRKNNKGAATFIKKSIILKISFPLT